MAINFPEGTQNWPGDVTNGTVHTLNSNASVTWTGIPDGVTQITLSILAASQAGNDRMKIYLQDSSSGNWRTNSYEGTYCHINMSGGAGGHRQSAGFEIYGPSASYYGHGHVTLTRMIIGSTHYWTASNMVGQYNSEHISIGGGYHGLTAGHRLTGVNFAVGSSTFDAGYAILQYHF